MRHSNSDAALRLAATDTIDSYIYGTKYLQFDDTQVSSFNGVNLRLNKGLEDVGDDTIHIEKKQKIHIFIKKQQTEKLNWMDCTRCSTIHKS